LIILQDIENGMGFDAHCQRFCNPYY